MKASQSPEKTPPMTVMARPAPIMRIEITRPPPAARRVAPRRSPFHCQRAARSMRPPSSGRAGSRLKSSSAALVKPSHASTPSAGSGRPSSAPPMKAPASASETSGPAIAMRNSAPAEGNMPRKRATPPNSQSVMPSICMPSRPAWSAWPSSCSRIEPKKPSDATTAIAK